MKSFGVPSLVALSSLSLFLLAPSVLLAATIPLGSLSTPSFGGTVPSSVSSGATGLQYISGGSSVGATGAANGFSTAGTAVSGAGAVEMGAGTGLSTAGSAAAQSLGASADPTAVASCLVYPYNQACTTGSFFGMYFATGMCRGYRVCVAMNVTPLGAIAVGLGTNLVNTALNAVINGARGGTRSGYPTTVINTGGQGCTSGRYYTTSNASLLSDPCARYAVPTATTTNPGACSVSDYIAGTCGGTSTSNTANATNASLSVSPTSGQAPLSVTITVADTSSSCARSPIMLSTGNGTSTTMVFPATSACGARTPASYTYTYITPGTYQAAVSNGSTGQTLQTVTVTVTPSSATLADFTNASLSVNPTSGPAPLTVKFTVSDTSPTDTSSACKRSPIVLSAGDGSANVTAFPAANVCVARTAVSFTYTYRSGGTYYATIVNSTSGKTLQSAMVAVGGGGSGTVDVSSSLLNIVSNLPATSAAQSAGPPVGNVATSVNSADIQLAANGATIVSGGVRDQSRNMGASAFFGADTQAGVSSQNLAARICLVRPWQNPLFSSRIQPSLFDSLCTAKGFQAGVPVSTAPAAVAKPAASKQQSAATAPPPATQSATPPVAPAVAVWAVPASVSIGTRTSIFWNSRGVTSCIVTSPDGSFSQSTLSGSASTVPLAGPTVYTISCLAPDGSHVSNFVKVDISS